MPPLTITIEDEPLGDGCRCLIAMLQRPDHMQQKVDVSARECLQKMIEYLDQHGDWQVNRFHVVAFIGKSGAPPQNPAADLI